MWNEEKKRVTLQLEKEFAQRLSGLARRYHRTLSSQIAYMAERELDRIATEEEAGEQREGLKVER